MKKRHHNSKFDIKTEKLICKLYLEDTQNTAPVLAKRFNCTYTAIYTALRGNGVPIRTFTASQKGLYINGRRHKNFKGGTVNVQGYRVVYSKLHEATRHEHRVIMEEHLGRALRPGEEVHHINRNRLDNRLENLLVVSQEDHRKLHKRKYHRLSSPV